MPEQADVKTEAIELRVPATVEQLPVLRAVAATVAANAGFDVDGIADTRMLTDELCGLLLRTAVGDELRCTLLPTDTGLLLEFSTTTEREVWLPDAGLRRRILDTLSDSLETWGELDDGNCVSHVRAVRDRPVRA